MIYKDNKVDAIFNKIDDWLLIGDFSTCNQFLNNLVINDMSDEELITVLTATYPAANKLKAWKSTVSRIEYVLTKRGRNIEKLLIGFCQ